MTHHQSAIHELAERLLDNDASLTTSIAEIFQTAMQELIEAELTARIGAEPGECAPTRTAQRNGHRPKLLSTPAGDIFCKLIDDDVAVLRQRRLDQQPFVYVWLDATYVHVREHGQVVSKAVVIATGVRGDGHREVLGLDIGDSENETFWTEFLRDLKDRGLDGVQLVISDAHAGLRAAIRRVLQGAGWQRCRVHAKRNLLAVAKHQHRQVVSALISTIFAQPDDQGARTQLRAVVDQLEHTEPKVAQRLQAMEDDLLATPRSRPCTGPRSGPTTPSRD